MASTRRGVRRSAGDGILGSLVRSPVGFVGFVGQLLYNTILQSMHQVQRRSNPELPSAHARLPCPWVDALLTLALGCSMVHYDIPNACKLFTFMHVLASWYR